MSSVPLGRSPAEKRDKYCIIGGKGTRRENHAPRKRLYCTQCGGLYQLDGCGLSRHGVTRDRDEDPFRYPVRSASLGKRGRQNCVPCLDDGATYLLSHPNAFRLAAIDFGDCTVTERVVVGGIDHDDVGGHVIEEAGEIGISPERDYKNDCRYVLHSLLLRDSGSSSIARKIAESVWPLRIGELDFMAAGGELSRQGGADISGADDSDLHGISFRECAER